MGLKSILGLPMKWVTVPSGSFHAFLIGAAAVCFLRFALAIVFHSSVLSAAVVLAVGLLCCRRGSLGNKSFNIVGRKNKLPANADIGNESFSDKSSQRARRYPQLRTHFFLSEKTVGLYWYDG
jgi:hypothetical protein